MRKILFLTILFSSMVNYSIAQLNDSITMFAKSINLDTTVNPNYYDITIGLTEYYGKNKKRGSKRILITIDSVKVKLFQDLEIFVKKDSVELTNIQEFITNNYYQEKKIYYFFSFKYHKKDSIQYLSSYFKKEFN